MPCQLLPSRPSGSDPKSQKRLVFPSLPSSSIFSSIDHYCHRLASFETPDLDCGVLIAVAKVCRCNSRNHPNTFLPICKLMLSDSMPHRSCLDCDNSTQLDLEHLCTTSIVPPADQSCDSQACQFFQPATRYPIPRSIVRDSPASSTTLLADVWLTLILSVPVFRSPAIAKSSAGSWIFGRHRESCYNI